MNNTFRNYFLRLVKNSGLIKFLGVPPNQTLKKRDHAYSKLCNRFWNLHK